jgi:predicted nucleotide-binding protein
MKLRVFIGSSSESLNVANAIQHGLGSDIECVVWPDSFFKLSSSTINDLAAGLDKFGAGIFVFGDDDKPRQRKSLSRLPSCVSGSLPKKKSPERNSLST